MHPTFGDSYPSEDGKGTGLHVGIERTLFQKRDDLGMIASMGVMVMALLVLLGIVSMRMMMAVLVVLVMMVSGLAPLIHPFLLDTFMPTYDKAPSGDAVPVPAFEAA